MVLEKATVVNLFKQIKSGIAFDIAPGHTGILIWNGETIETYGFKLPDRDKSDVFWEYRMRRDFKEKVKEIVQGRQFEHCIVEGCYGGENFDTVQQLLALNTVPDELLFEHVFFVDNFYRKRVVEWMAKTRKLYKQRGKLVSKIETQGILEFLEFDFYLKNKDLSNADKERIFFEDICDACGMLLSVVVDTTMEQNRVKHANIKLSDIKMFYLNTVDFTGDHKDKRIREECFVDAPLTNMRAIKESIISNIQENPYDVLMSELPVSALGRFGIEQKFTFYPDGEGYLLYYLKGGDKVSIPK